MNPILLSVVIPAYNEERRIARTLDEIVQFVRRRPRLAGIPEPLSPDATEIILSDDGSTDRTQEVARETLKGLGAELPLRVVASPVNRGKGHAVRSGVLASRGRYVLFCDADGATPFWEVARLFEALDAGHDIAIGSRALPDSRIAVPQPWHRRVLGLAMRVLVSRLLVAGFRDTQCGFKLFRAEAARAIFQRQTVDGFSFDVEVLFLARRLGYSVCEVPVEWHDRPGSKVHPVRSPVQMLAELVSIRWRHRPTGCLPGPSKRLRRSTAHPHRPGERWYRPSEALRPSTTSWQGPATPPP